MGTSDPVERLPLSLPVFQVLLSLTQGPLHGYAILTDIQARSQTPIQLGAGTLYAAIKRMTASGMLEECEPPADDPEPDSRRRYYSITDHGREIAAAETRRLRSLAALAADRLQLAPEASGG